MSLLLREQFPGIDLEACPYIWADWESESGRCKGCGGDLPRTKAGLIPKGRVWCSSECSDAFSQNHWWSSARNQAVRLAAGHCASCGRWTCDFDGAHRGCRARFCPGREHSNARPYRRCSTRMDSYPARRGRNVYHFEDGLHWVAGTGHLSVAIAVKDRTENRVHWRAIWGWEEFTQARRAEVNHVTPLNGNRPDMSCKHHVDRLEVLCHKCHVSVTAEQRAKGILK